MSPTKPNISTTIAHDLLTIGAVGFSFDHPLTFKSGVLSPIYIDNRRFPSHPKEWHDVIEGFAALITENSLQFDYLAGIETAGIPHSSALGFFLNKPSVFVRKAIKDHGTKKRIEGGEVQGKKVLLVEDLISTGGSSLSGVEALREAGATVTDCLAITNYEFPETPIVFQDAKVTLWTLVTFTGILEQVETQMILTTTQLQDLKRWSTDPHAWRPT